MTPLVYGLCAVGWLCCLFTSCVLVFLDDTSSAEWWWILLSALGGAIAAALVFGVQSLVFPQGLTRDPDAQARNAARAYAGSLGAGAAGFLALSRLADDGALIFIASVLGFLPVMLGWRAWFDRSSYARRRWPEPDKR